MKSEMGKLMENIKVGDTCPANCGGKIIFVDYSTVGQGAFLQCDRNGTIHFKRISPPTSKTAVYYRSTTVIQK